MSRFAVLGLMALALLGCDEAPTQVTLALVWDDDPSSACDQDTLGTLRHISVELFAIKPEMGLCQLGHTCAAWSVGPVSDLNDIVTAIQMANQPLIDLPAQDASTVGVIGHSQTCFDTAHVLCGYQDLANIRSDGTLEIEIGCGPCVPLAGDQFCPPDL